MPIAILKQCDDIIDVQNSNELFINELYMIQWSFGLTSATIQMTLVREGAAGIRYFQIMIIDHSILCEQHTSSVISVIINHTFCLLHILPDFISVMIVLLWRNGLELFLFVCIFVSSSLQGFPSTSSRTYMITSMFIMELTHFRGPNVSFYVTVWSTYSSALRGDQRRKVIWIISL